jgi:hypothetical protein
MGIYDFMTTPLVPQSVTQPVTQKLTEPRLNQSPLMAGVKGFGAGALEGLRGLTSPANLAGIAGTAAGAGELGWLGKGAQGLMQGTQAAGGAGEALQGLTRAAPGTGSLVAEESMLPKAINSVGDLRGSWAEEMANQAAKLRGSASDIPQNPGALRMEAIRRGLQ